MRRGFLSDDLDKYQPDEDEDMPPMRVDNAAGAWVRCPECDSQDAGFIHWGEGVDMNFYCPDCGASHGVR